MFGLRPTAPHLDSTISADMVAPSNHLHVRFAPNRYRDAGTRQTFERRQCTKSLCDSGEGGWS